MEKRSLGIILWIFSFPFYSFSTNSPLPLSHNIDSSSLQARDYRAISAIQKKYSSLNNLIQRRTQHMLARMEKKEIALQEALRSKDSTKAAIVFPNIRARYDRLNSLLHSPIDPASPFPLKQYVAGTDSTHTALRFLAQSPAPIEIVGNQLQKIQAASAEVQQVEGKLQQAEDIKQFMTQREQELTSQLGHCGLNNQLLGINKEAFYAQQQIIEYKSMINDKDKLEEAFLSRINDVPAFSGFMEKHSYLGQLFGLPDNYSSVQSLAGLQTRSQVQQLIGQFAGAQTGKNGAGADPTQYLQQQMQQAQQQLSQLKDKLNVLGNSGGSGDITMPQSRPNEERTKTWLNRLEYGFNMQTQQSTSLLPSLANLSLTIGYKLNQRFSLGIGGSYRVGLGTGLNHLAFSNQGIGIRTYTNMYLKGNIGISGGIEYNYMQAFVKWPSINRPDIWQRSALIGLIKRTKVSGHKEATIQLLYDALYRQHIPASAPLIFRLGYTFK